MFASDCGGGAVHVRESSTENKPAREEREGENERAGRRRRKGKRLSAGTEGQSLRFNGIKTAQFLYGLPALIAVGHSSL